MQATPRHIAIIPDGNRRWALQKNLPLAHGHQQGVEVLTTILPYCYDIGVEIVTIYAFSYENWNRPQNEQAILFSLIDTFIKEKLAELIQKRIHIEFIGSSAKFPETIKENILNAQTRTAAFTQRHLQIALGYGGRNEIIRAVQAISTDVSQGKLDTTAISEEIFAQYLDTAGIPDPDLMIRTSGEIRISNFLLYQLAYSELFFSPTLWPDFSTQELAKILKAYAERERRFGGNQA